MGNAVSSVRVTATKNHDDASIAQRSGVTRSLSIVGVTKTITVTVTAEDGTTGDYTVRVTRDEPGVSDDATLGALTLSDGAIVLSPDVRPGHAKVHGQCGERC